MQPGNRPTVNSFQRPTGRYEHLTGAVYANIGNVHSWEKHSRTQGIDYGTPPFVHSSAQEKVLKPANPYATAPRTIIIAVAGSRIQVM